MLRRRGAGRRYAGGNGMGVQLMRIVMIGAGYVGLVSGACLADFGHEVVCVEVDESKVAGLREGRVPIYEPGLSELVLANQAAGRLIVHDQPQRGRARREGDFHRGRHAVARRSRLGRHALRA